MEYLRFGNENGEKFVILPGLALKSVMGAAEAIKSAYGLIAGNYDVYLFDRPAEEREGRDLADMADDTLAAFDRAGLDRVHLMGVSMGGMVSQIIALKAPERVASLILCSTAMSAANVDRRVFEEWKRLAEQRDARALSAAFGKSVYTPSFFERHRELILAAGDGATERDFRSFLISLNAVRGFDLGDKIRDIACPAFVLGAGDDRVVGANAARELMEALNCGGYIYEGRGHAVYDEEPDFLSRIDAFLKTAGAGK